VAGSVLVLLMGVACEVEAPEEESETAAEREEGASQESAMACIGYEQLSWGWHQPGHFGVPAATAQVTSSLIDSIDGWAYTVERSAAGATLDDPLVETDPAAWLEDGSVGGFLGILIERDPINRESLIHFDRADAPVGFCPAYVVGWDGSTWAAKAAWEPGPPAPIGLRTTWAPKSVLHDQYAYVRCQLIGDPSSAFHQCVKPYEATIADAAATSFTDPGPFAVGATYQTTVCPRLSWAVNSNKSNCASATITYPAPPGPSDPAPNVPGDGA
jgi:hypothetical protein